MTVTTENVRTVVNPSALRDALTATLLSAGKEDTLPVLKSVQIQKQGKHLILRSTDRYRLTRATITLDAVNEAAPDWTVLIGADDAKRVVTALPKPTRYAVLVLVSLAVGDDALVVDTGQSVLRVQMLDFDYPKTESIIPTDFKEVGQIGFNPKFLIDLAKMPGRARNEAVRLRFAGEGKPCVSEWSADDVAYLYVLMPVRLTS